MNRAQHAEAKKKIEDAIAKVKAACKSNPTGTWEKETLQLLIQASLSFGLVDVTDNEKGN